MSERQAVLSDDRVEVLLERRVEFLRFLSSRINDRAMAEDILHSAYLKAMERGDQLRQDESIVAWFYRILRNSVADYYRRSEARDSAHERYAAEIPAFYEAELRQQACACVKDVVQDLKSEYRDAIEHVDLAEEPIEEFAKANHISANNASVRLHRARRSLAGKLAEVCGVCAEHKCVDCTCRRAKL